MDTEREKSVGLLWQVNALPGVQLVIVGGGPAESAAFADAVARLARDPQLRVTMGQAGRVKTLPPAPLL